MGRFPLSRGSRVVGLCGAVTMVLAGPVGHAAQAAPHSTGAAPAHPVVPAHSHPAPAATDKPATLAPGDTPACTTPTLTQAFLWARDRNWYTLVPGQAPDSFTGAGGR